MLQIVVLDDETKSAVRLPNLPATCLPHLKRFVEELSGSAGPGRPGMPVVVTGLNDPEYSPHLAPRGSAQPVTLDEVFPSAMALSLHLGFKFNSVGQALAKSAREQEKKAQDSWQREGHPGRHTSRVRPEGTIRGVTFMYEKDLPG